MMTRSCVDFGAAFFLCLVLVAGAPCEGMQWLQELQRHVPQPWPATLEVKPYRSLSARNVTRALYAVEEFKDIDIKLFRSFWRRLPAHSAVALRAPQKHNTNDETMLKISKELIYKINEVIWTKIDFDVAEMVCTACGCLAFRGSTFGGHGRMRHWKRHWRRSGDFYHLGLESKTDKLSLHDYEFMYQRTLPNLVKGDCLLEIGFGCGMAYGAGASAQLWPKLFPEAQIHLVEVNEPCVRKMGQSFLEEQNYTVHIADQGKVSDLERLKDEVLPNCSQFSVIIDDGSHESDDIIRSFHSLYPLLKSGGIYFIEDIGWSSYSLYQYPFLVRDGALESPGVSIHFVVSLLPFLFRRGRGLPAPYPYIEAIHCRLNICALKNA